MVTTQECSSANKCNITTSLHKVGTDFDIERSDTQLEARDMVTAELYDIKGGKFDK